MRPTTISSSRPTRWAFLPLLLLSACANPVKQSMHDADMREDEATRLIRDMQGTSAVSRQTVEVHQDQWVDPTPIPLDVAKRAPQLDCVEKFTPARPVSLDEFAQTVSEDCHIQVHINADARRLLSGRAGQGVDAGGAIAAAPYGASGAILPAVPKAGIGAQNYGVPGGAQSKLDLDYTGPLPGLLDAATAQLGLGWKVSNEEIYIFYTDSRTFRLDMIPTATSMTSTVVSGTTTQAGISSAGGSGGSSGGGSNGGVTGSSGTTQQTDVTVKNDPRKDFEETIKSMLTKGVGEMGPLTATGTITVTDTPEVLATIQSYVDSQNGILTKQVLLNVRILSVTLNNNDNYGINWGLVFKDLSGKYGFNLTNSSPAAQNSVSGAISILSTATGHTKQFAGSTAIMNALAQQGKVSVVTSPSATTLNMQPVIVQVAKQTGYLASAATNQVAQVGSSTSLQPGMITSGFNMNLLPYVLADGKTLLLQYNMNLSSDPNLRTITSGGSTIEIPEMDTKILSHKVRMVSGETLVLSGFEQSNNNGNRQGVGSPKFWLLGGGLSRNDSRVVLVVLITPIVSG